MSVPRPLREIEKEKKFLERFSIDRVRGLYKDNPYQDHYYVLTKNNSRIESMIGIESCCEELDKILGCNFWDINSLTFENKVKLKEYILKEGKDILKDYRIFLKKEDEETFRGFSFCDYCNSEQEFYDCICTRCNSKH